MLTEAGLEFQYEPITFEVLEGFPFECLEKIGNRMGHSKKTRPVRYTPDFVGND
jgi:hypothetical protein